MTIDPNPVPYNSETEEWFFKVILSESNGLGVTLTSLTFDGYNQQGLLIYTHTWYEEDISLSFGTNYLPAFSTLHGGVIYRGTSKYAILTVGGIDDKDNPVEATGRVDYLPK